MVPEGKWSSVSLRIKGDEGKSSSRNCAGKRWTRADGADGAFSYQISDGWLDDQCTPLASYPYLALGERILDDVADSKSSRTLSTMYQEGS